MSVIPPAIQGHAPGGTETELYALIAVISDKAGFQKRLNELVIAKDEARQALNALAAKEAELAEREAAAVALKAEADAKGGMYHRGLEELAAKVDQVNREREDLGEARKAWEAEAKIARGKVDEDAAALKLITDGLEERERVAADVMANGQELQIEFGKKLEQLKNLAGA